MMQHSSRYRNFFLITCLASQGLIACAAADAQASKSVAKAPLNEHVQTLVVKVMQSIRLIEGGTFEMGDWGNEEGLPYDMFKDSKPLHKVTLDTFSMMAYKVTYEDFDVFTEATGKPRINMELSKPDLYGNLNRTPKLPAGVSWYGARDYCLWLGKVTKLPFDLPTEAQWEYAARSGGKRMLYATDNGEMNRGRNYPPEREWGQPRLPILDVASFPPNPAGLYGMSEGFREWAKDWYAEDYYQHSPVKNPQGPVKGTKKVQRGNHGSPAEAAALVFIRGDAAPLQTRSVIKGDKLVDAPFPRYSSYESDTFRCVVNSKQKLN